MSLKLQDIMVALKTDKFTPPYLSVRVLWIIPPHIYVEPFLFIVFGFIDLYIPSIVDRGDPKITQPYYLSVPI